MKRLAINANGNTITSFARELNPTGVREYIYIYKDIIQSSKSVVGNNSTQDE